MTTLAPLPPAPRPPASTTWAPVLENERIADRYHALRLLAPEVAATALPGQFVMLSDFGPLASRTSLPRPMAVYATDPVAGEVELVYARIGAGTRLLADVEAGSSVRVVGPLGRGFDLRGEGDVLLLGRGVGVFSLTLVPHVLRGSGRRVTTVLSARSRAALLGSEHVAAAAAGPVLEVLDVEGSSDPAAVRTRLTALLDEHPPTEILTCGSRRLEALAGVLGQRWDARVQVSVEANMACGIGYCHGCAAGVGAGGTESSLVCVDGPVFQLVPERPRAASCAGCARGCRS